MSKVAQNEYFEVVQALRKHHSLFAQFWSVGNIIEINSPKMPTAAVRFDKKSGQGLQFLINPGFWATLNEHDKAFVISHEIMHVYLDHGRRSLGLDLKIANYAQDVVINHYLVDYFGFDRNSLTFADRYCWIDTMFPGRNDIEPDRCFEYYYEKLMDQGGPPQNMQGDPGDGQPGQGQGEGGEPTPDQEGQPQSGYGNGGEPVTVDMHDFLDEDEDDIDDELLDEIQKAAEELMDRITPEEVEDFEEKISKGSKEESDKVEEEKRKHKGAGSMAGTMEQRIRLGRVKKKRKWETVIADVIGRFQGMERDMDIELWTRPNRRLAGMVSGDDDLMLPACVHESVPVRDRVDVWFFQDTSGSCKHLAERFFKAAASIPDDHFRVRIFCFDTKVYETDLKSGKLYGFGGTSFQPMENAIQGILQREPKTNYPQAVFVVTDGDAWDGRMQAQFPDRWHWFLTDGGTTSCIPHRSHIYKLRDYE